MKNWYYLDDAGDVQGPLAWDSLAEMCACGTLAVTDMVCLEGTESWTTFGQASGSAAVPAINGGNGSVPDQLPQGAVESEPEPPGSDGIVCDGTTDRHSRDGRRMPRIALIAVVALVIGAGALLLFPREDPENLRELSYYCRKSNFGKVRALGSQHNVNYEDAWGIPLHEAIEGGHPDLVRYLLRLGARLDQPNVSGLYPIHIAARTGNSEIFELLLEEGARPDQLTTEPRSSAQSPGLIARNQRRQPIHYAAEARHLSIVEQLFEQGVSPGAETLDGASALSLARPLSVEWMTALDPTGRLLREYRERMREADGSIRFDGVYQLANATGLDTLEFHIDGTVTRTSPKSAPDWVIRQTGVATQKSTGTFTVKDGVIAVSFGIFHVQPGLSQSSMLESPLPGTVIESVSKGSARGDSIVISSGNSSEQRVYEFVPSGEN